MWEYSTVVEQPLTQNLFNTICFQSHHGNTAADISVSVTTLLNSGSAGNFFFGALCHELQLQKRPNTIPVQGSFCVWKAARLTLVCYCGRSVHRLHTEIICLLALENSTTGIIVGPLLVQKWDKNCFQGCPEFSPLIPPSSRVPVYTPSCYAPLGDVSYPKRAS